MENANQVKYKIYGVSLTQTDELYVGCAFHNGEIDEANLGTESHNAAHFFSKYRIEEQSNYKSDLFEIETLASKDEATEALDFWRNYFRSLGAYLVIDRD